MAIITVLLIGASGITAQVLLLRELLISFYGNELTLGVILASWILSEALGVYITGRAIDRVKNHYFVFICLQMIFALALPASVYLSRTFKALMGISPGQGLGLSAIFLSSFFIMLPLGFCHGGLFSLACKIFFPDKQKAALTIGRVYFWETAGTLLGGVILTFLFIPFLDSFSIVFVVSISNILVCFFFLGSLKSRMQAYAVFSLLFLSIFAFAVVLPSRLQSGSIKKQYTGTRVLDYRNSVYGNLAVAESGSQRTLFYNGLPVITAPYPDIASVEEFGNFPLLFHHNPKAVLIISHAAGGLLNEVLKSPVEKIDYIELDPLIFKMLKKFPSDLIKREISDKRVDLIASDGRFFLNSAPLKYDVIMLGISGPANLSTNRFFTKEFFALAKSRLNKDGILAFRLPGSLTYISAALRDLNFSIVNGLRSEFLNCRVIPGDYNLILASDSGHLLESDSGVLNERISGRNIKTVSLLPQYIDYRMDKNRQLWFSKSTINATDKINSDFSPFALMPALVLWNRQFSPGAAFIFESLRGFSFRHVFLFVFILTIALSFFKTLKPETGTRFSVGYVLMTTGFYAMFVNLILIFSFQVLFGYLYEKIGVLMAVFMAGTAAGSFITTRSIRDADYRADSLVKFEALIGIFCLLLALALYNLNIRFQNLVFFIFLFFSSGFLAGLEFPVAGRVLLKDKNKIGQVSGMLYSFDLLGGCLAGIIGSMVLLPVLGLFDSCVALAFLKAGSAITLVLKKSKKRVDKN
jgi:spermidine synthase